MMTTRIQEPVRTHLLRLSNGIELCVKSGEGDEVLQFAWGDLLATDMSSEDCWALVSVLLAHEERLTRRIGA